MMRKSEVRSQIEEVKESQKSEVKLKKWNRVTGPSGDLKNGNHRGALPKLARPVTPASQNRVGWSPDSRSRTWATRPR